jgi:hypothetical protein
MDWSAFSFRKHRAGWERRGRPRRRVELPGLLPRFSPASGAPRGKPPSAALLHVLVRVADPDPRLHKASGNLVIGSIHAELGASRGREVAAQVGETIARFAAFVGTSQVTCSSRVPEVWKSALR